MKFFVKNQAVEKMNTDCLILGYFAEDSQPSVTAHIDKVSERYLSSLYERGDISGQLGETLLLQNVPNVAAERLLIVGLGKKKELTAKNLHKAIAASFAALNNTPVTTTVSTLPKISVSGKDLTWRTRQAAVAALEHTYRFDELKTTPEPKPATLTEVTFHSTNEKEAKQIKSGIKLGEAIAKGINVAKDLGNNPSNICTPSYLANQAKQLAKDHSNVKTKILSEADMDKLGMHSFLSVSKGSKEPGKLIIMEYQGSRKKTAKPIVLVGKGITFDSGGISLKPGASMDEMKYDMGGAASVFGTLNAVAEMKLPINVIGIVAAAENMPGGGASKPGDIVKSMSGQTIEILNTDAEGRLVLCDALTYCERFEPEVVIDIATLTGAMVVALGNHRSGVFTNTPALSKALEKAGETSLDPTWPMPLDDEYQDLLKSPFADMANIGGRYAGAITAACFLARFTKNLQWAHLDVAGVAWHSGANKGGTGRPVPLLTQFILDRC